MKMKKSKIIVPALGLLLLSTAASVSGTVAWFTANRTYSFTAGEFAVVNTKDNLEASLGAGLGTSADNENKKITVTNSAHVLTDASFDHTSLTQDIIAPDAEGKKVGKVIPLASALYTGDASYGLLRETNVYTAFTWTITFTMRFSANPTSDVGLFLSLGSNTWVHEAYKAVGGESGTGYYTDDKLTVAAPGTLVAGTTYYKELPDDTGKAFRVAIVPTTVPANSLGFTKVWADRQTSAKCQFVDGLSVDTDLAGTAYGTETTQFVNGTRSAATAGSGKVLMDSADTTAVPTSGTITKAAALSGYSNYLGYFHRAENTAVSMTYTCVAWYEGTDENITNDEETIYERVTTSMEFGVYNVADA
ncbi:MAG: hypothetical protein IJQ67_00145 [Bacilli bacterium]|nr:hypothetical protein [Bacilli bacterium]